MNLPILYSFRRCPYAIRTRLAIAYSQRSVQIREILLKDKPQEMLSISPKGTVPVLQLENNTVLEESLDIIAWAIKNNNPTNIHLIQYDDFRQNELIIENDAVFKIHLDCYKYADRYPQEEVYYRKQGEVFLKRLDTILAKQEFLSGDQLSVIDFSVFPFVRQFAYVDKAWFDQSLYQHLRKWLNKFLISALFNSVMHKTIPWKPGDKPIVFPVNDSPNMLDS